MDELEKDLDETTEGSTSDLDLAEDTEDEELDVPSEEEAY